MLMLLLGFVLGAGMGIAALFARDAGYQDGLHEGFEMGVNVRDWMEDGNDV